MKAAGYIRVSTPSQAKEGESLSTQKKQIEFFIKSKGWELTKIYEDAGYSGKNTERPGFQSLMDNIKKGRIDVVILVRLSRFARNTRDLLNKINELKKHNVQFVSIKESIDLSSSYNEAVMTILAAVAQLEGDIINEQSDESRIRNLEDNMPAIGELPWGRTFEKSRGGKEGWGIDTGEKTEGIDKKKLTAKIAKRYIDGESLTKLAKEYGMGGYNQWLRRFKKDCGTEWPVNFKGKKYVLKVPRLLSDEMIVAVKRRIESNRTTTHGEYKYKWLLSRMIFCNNCGKPMSAHPVNTKLKSGIKTYFYYYHQKKNPDDIREGCTISINADKIEEAVALYLFNMYGDEEYLKRSVKMAFPNPEKRIELENERESKLKKCKEIENKMNNIVEAIAERVFSKDQARKNIENYQEQLDLINERIEAIDLELKDIPTQSQIDEKIDQFRLRHEALSQLPERLSEMPYNEMKKMVLTAFNGKDIHGNRLGVYVKNGASKKEFTFTIKGMLPEDDIYGDLPLTDDDYEDLLCWPTNRNYDLEKEKEKFRLNILGKHR